MQSSKQLRHWPDKITAARAERNMIKQKHDGHRTNQGRMKSHPPEVFPPFVDARSLQCEALTKQTHWNFCWLQWPIRGVDQNASLHSSQGQRLGSEKNPSWLFFTKEHLDGLGSLRKCTNGIVLWSTTSRRVPTNNSALHLFAIFLNIQM